MNKVVLIGRLTKAPDLGYMQNQKAIARFTLAVNRQRRQGEAQGADFLRITVFDKQAENCNLYLDKGSQVAVSGRIQTGSYTDNKGDKVYTTDIVADSVEFLSRKNDNNADVNNNVDTQGTAFSGTQMDMSAFEPFAASEEDIPF